MSGHKRLKRAIQRYDFVVNESVIGPAATLDMVVLDLPHACTVYGWSWDLRFVQGSSSENSRVWWAIVVKPDGETPEPLTLLSGFNKMSRPVQAVIAVGHAYVDYQVDTLTGPDIGGYGWATRRSDEAKGSSRSQRKAPKGGRVWFKAAQLATPLSQTRISGVITFFTKI